ncbi:hypothetical protein D3C77_359340 [compost metagenome]
MPEPFPYLNWVARQRILLEAFHLLKKKGSAQLLDPASGCLHSQPASQQDTDYERQSMLGNLLSPEQLLTYAPGGIAHLLQLQGWFLTQAIEIIARSVRYVVV